MDGLRCDAGLINPTVYSTRQWQDARSGSWILRANVAEAMTRGGCLAVRLPVTTRWLDAGTENEKRHETKRRAMTLIQNRHRHKHCLDPRLGRRLMCLSGTQSVPRQLHHVLFLACSFLTDKCCRTFSSLTTRLVPTLAVFRFYSPSIVLLRSTHPFVPKALLI